MRRDRADVSVCTVASMSSEKKKQPKKSPSATLEQPETASNSVDFPARSCDYCPLVTFYLRVSRLKKSFNKKMFTIKPHQKKKTWWTFLIENSDADEAKTKARGPDMAQQSRQYRQLYILVLSCVKSAVDSSPFSIIPGVQNHLQQFCSCPPSCFLISCCSLETAMSQTFTDEILCHVPLRTRVSVLTGF